MALLNLLLIPLLAALGLFDTDGSGGDDDAGTGTGGSGGTSGSGDGDDDDAGAKPDDPAALKAEIAKWKGLSRKHEASAKTNADAARRLQAAEDADKTEIQKATDKALAADKRADLAEARILRLEIAAEKGLTQAQAKRLMGATREELEADADELLEAFGGKNGAGDRKEPLKRPATTTRSGSVPDAEPEDNDPAKLAAKVPRL